MRALLVAGGSGGHLIPALMLAEHLNQFHASCSILSTSRPVDRLVAGDSSFPWITVDLERFSPFRRWIWPPYLVRQLKAFRQMEKALSRLQPDVMIGFGGYLSAVGLFLARRAGVPAILHEQNLLPGQANRWLAPFADRVAVSFPETKQYLSRRAKVEVTGNPIRRNPLIDPVRAREYFGFDGERPVLLVMGGSQGSGAINRWAVQLWQDRPPVERRRVQILHLAGLAESSPIEAAYQRLGMSARVFSFLKEMPIAYTASTLAISRAGATTIAELVEYRLAAILIPYPYAGGHQQANALWMDRQGGAMVIQEGELLGKRLWEAIEPLLSDLQRLDRMRAALSARANGSAAQRLGELVKQVAG